VSATLETRDLTIRFGGQVAVDRVSCAFASGTLTAIVGPNGAGKTTYFNLISGQLPATSGDVFLAGARITALSAPLRARRGLGRAFQLTNLFPDLSVFENVRLAVQARAGIGLDIIHMAADHQALTDHALDRLGDQRKLEVAILLALEPDIFMFDEPTAGMSVDEVPVVLDLIESIKAMPGKTVLLVEHKMDVVRRLADRVIVLDQGRLVADGLPAEIVASAVVREAYLGIRPADG
jgi:branched-chain amino acid transport system ATP-binding protein